MTAEKNALERAGAAWLDFWFIPPPLHNMAAMRVGTGLILLYTLLIRSYDLEMQLSARLLGDPAVMSMLDQMAWPFSFFNWSDGSGWIWTVHIAAIATAAAFTLGILPTVTGFLALAFLLSYAHRNPAAVLGLDGLLLMGVAYLMLMPSGAKLSVPGGQLRPGPAPPDPRREAEEEQRVPWSGLVMRAFQLHLCVIYFQSGLARLNASWLAGMALWHPRLVEQGTPFTAETLRDAPYLLGIIPTGLALFELFFGVLIWIPWLRYPALAVAVAVHLSVGVLWDKLPFNLLMIVFSVAFIRPAHLGFILENAGLALQFGWESTFAGLRERR